MEKADNTPAEAKDSAPASAPAATASVAPVVTTAPAAPAMSLTDEVIDFILSFGGSESGLSAEEKKVITWMNSAGQVIQSRRVERLKLENIAQAHIDSYASYVDTATPESKLQNAKSIAEMFSFTAKGARVIEDVENGEGRYRFTVQTEPSKGRTIV